MPTAARRTKPALPVASSAPTAATAKQQLDGFLNKFLPEIARDARAMLAKLRKRLPTATIMVYDNYNALAIGFAPGERPSEAIFSIAVFPQWVTFCFLQGAKLADPTKRLKGGGSTVRHVRLVPLAIYDEPDVQALIDAALASAKVPLPATGKSRLIIKSISAKQRPRRPEK
jgi:hypothetical protein